MQGNAGSTATPFDTAVGSWETSVLRESTRCIRSRRGNDAGHPSLIISPSKYFPVTLTSLFYLVPARRPRQQHDLAPSARLALECRLSGFRIGCSARACWARRHRSPGCLLGSRWPGYNHNQHRDRSCREPAVNYAHHNDNDSHDYSYAYAYWNSAYYSRRWVQLGTVALRHLAACTLLTVSSSTSVTQMPIPSCRCGRPCAALMGMLSFLKENL